MTLPKTPSIHPTSLTTIPYEISDAILQHVDQASLLNFIQCSHTFHKLGLAPLYRNISLSEVPYKTDLWNYLGKRFYRSRVTIPYLYDLTYRIVNHPILASHVRTITIIPHCLKSVSAARIGQGIKIPDLDERLHWLVRHASSSRRRYKMWIRQIKADRDTDVVLALLVASLPSLQSLSLHFRLSFNKALRHLSNRKDTAIFSQHPLEHLRHVSHLHPDDCDENCFIEDRADFPMAIFLKCPSVESISGVFPCSPHQTTPRGFGIPESTVSSLKELSLDYRGDHPPILPGYVSRAIEVSPQLRSLELRLYCHEETDATEKLFRALAMRASTLEKLTLEQSKCCICSAQYCCDAHNILRRIFSMTHFKRLTSLKLDPVSVFGVGQEL